MGFENITLTTSGAIATLTMNRPENLNAFNTRTVVEMLDAIVMLRDDAAVRAVVLTGAGRAFTSGGDIREMTEFGTRPQEDYMRHMQNVNRMVLGLHELPKPVIAAVNGPAAGLGFNLALAADLRIAAQSATFSQAFIKIGLVPDGGGSYLLPRIVGLARATELILTGRTVAADEALALGLVNRVVADAELGATVQALAEQLAAAPTGAIARDKELLRRSLTSDFASQLQAEIEFQVERGASSDFREGITAFLEKRKPVFTGW